MEDDEILTQIAAEVKAMSDGYKADRTQLTTRLDDLERKFNKSRLLGNGGSPTETPEAIEAKASFTKFLRHGPDALNSTERKAMIVGDDPSGGYLAPSEIVNEIQRNGHFE